MSLGLWNQFSLCRPFFFFFFFFLGSDWRSPHELHIYMNVFRLLSGLEIERKKCVQADSHACHPWRNVYEAFEFIRSLVHYCAIRKLTNNNSSSLARRGNGAAHVVCSSISLDENSRTLLRLELMCKRFLGLPCTCMLSSCTHSYLTRNFNRLRACAGDWLLKCVCVSECARNDEKIPFWAHYYLSGDLRT